MKKAIGSKVDLNSNDNIHAVEFNKCVRDLYDMPDVQMMDEFTQHLHTSRLQHSINVSYYSYLICRNLSFDYRSAARAGLLHDLFLYDWRKGDGPKGNHVSVHPRVALENARRQAKLNPVEEDAIVRHMWPLTIRPPRYKESMVVSFVDKYCACCEVGGHLHRMAKGKVAVIRRTINGGVYILRHD